jgi:hypothetical protein
MDVLAADDGLVPWWFAVAFWVVFAALVLVVVRDVRRLGGVRRVLAELRRRLDDAGEPADPDDAADRPDRDTGRDTDRGTGRDAQ